jgi:putative glutamine amidotransferase
MPRPLIGITTYGRDEQNRFALPVEYVDSVRRAGGAVLLMPPGLADLDRWLEAVDGVILAGGGDIDPGEYGGAAHETVYMVDAERDRSELELARKVLRRGVPTFGICRGTQVINVALGGTLYEHLPDVVGEDVLHRAPPREPTPHAIQVDPGAGLAEILGVLQFFAASWHHQAIRDLAPSLKAVARAPDGIVEALEKPDHPWLHAVQWHPELTAAEDPVQQGLFDAVVDAVAQLR